MSKTVSADDADNLLTLHSAAEVVAYAADLGITGITENVVIRARIEGDLSATRITRAYWFSKRAVRDWLRGPTALPEGFDQ